MSAFIIYAIVLTLAYIIYYSAMITKDSYARKGQISDTTETFDVGDMNDRIESVTVNESKHGFYLGDENDEDNANEEELPDVTADGHGTTCESEPSVPSQAEQHAESAEAMMEEIEPEYSDSFEPDEFDMVLLNPANTVPVIITTDTRDEL